MSISEHPVPQEAVHRALACFGLAGVEHLAFDNADQFAAALQRSHVNGYEGLDVDQWRGFGFVEIDDAGKDALVALVRLNGITDKLRNTLTSLVGADIAADVLSVAGGKHFSGPVFSHAA